MARSPSACSSHAGPSITTYRPSSASSTRRRGARPWRPHTAKTCSETGNGRANLGTPADVEEGGPLLRSIHELSTGEGCMETYLILRRAAWHDVREAEEARARAAVEDERFSEVVEWKRSYTIAE